MAVGNRVEAGRQRQSGLLKLSLIQTIRSCVKTWSGLSESWGLRFGGNGNLVDTQVGSRWRRQAGGSRRDGRRLQGTGSPENVL
ncbi:unnamed protein product [Linum trigynum]|uniref:Uncharacterized protein n=1 Tax=Linum trigynum TaxID=586398 RepID=A0AAV2E4S1_9ROSI